MKSLSIKAAKWARCILGVSVVLAPPCYGVESWLSLRDSGVVRQQADYSCGAAALATLLTYFYLDPISEKTLLMQTMDSRTFEPAQGLAAKGLSFAEMAMLARSREYPVLGLELGYSDLKKLKVPVIVALEVHGRAHFSVLRKIDDRDRVFLADPSWGNRQWGRDEFVKSFTTEDDISSRGRILLVGSKHDRVGDDAFRHRPPRRVLIAPRR
ncbi:cysteine peptidase family C39 domain-containing protein [Congregibacter variabilis]|uniref:Cysteine peptidase family C39 domain-containing protein n=1 Tax=Congregibacter variabilis TaxID=3081200 RepID=A0ABZ0I4L9_9GAMM|nr:cysteine peptidase family C39 domain-containing protein [Congregibacter sp. IMCC43200]